MTQTFQLLDQRYSDFPSTGLTIHIFFFVRRVTQGFSTVRSRHTFVIWSTIRLIIGISFDVESIICLFHHRMMIYILLLDQWSMTYLSFGKSTFPLAKKIKSFFSQNLSKFGTQIWFYICPCGKKKKIIFHPKRNCQNWWKNREENLTRSTQKILTWKESIRHLEQSYFFKIFKHISNNYIIIKSNSSKNYNKK